MTGEYGVLQQSTSNVVAHGMSSQEEAKYRMWDAEPLDLRDPFIVALEATARRKQEEQNRLQALDRAMGYVAVPSMMVE